MVDSVGISRWFRYGCVLIQESQGNVRTVALAKKRRQSLSCIQVDHNGAEIPPPSNELLIEMARGIHLSVAGSAATDRGEDVDAFPRWDKLPDDVREYWIEGAKHAYAIIAIHGGGTVRKLHAEQD